MSAINDIKNLRILLSKVQNAISNVLYGLKNERTLDSSIIMQKNKIEQRDIFSSIDDDILTLQAISEKMVEKVYSLERVDVNYWRDNVTGNVNVFSVSDLQNSLKDLKTLSNEYLQFKNNCSALLTSANTLRAMKRGEGLKGNFETFNFSNRIMDENSLNQTVHNFERSITITKKIITQLETLVDFINTALKDIAKFKSKNSM